jgi:hypothetical protein
MLNLSRFDTDSKRDIISGAVDLNLRGNLDAIAVSQRLDEAIHPTDSHLDRARVISQREGGASTIST